MGDEAKRNFTSLSYSLIKEGGIACLKEKP